MRFDFHPFSCVLGTWKAQKEEGSAPAAAEVDSEKALQQIGRKNPLEEASCGLFLLARRACKSKRTCSRKAFLK